MSDNPAVQTDAPPHPYYSPAENFQRCLRQEKLVKASNQLGNAMKIKRRSLFHRKVNFALYKYYDTKPYQTNIYKHQEAQKILERLITNGYVILRKISPGHFRNFRTKNVRPFKLALLLLETIIAPGADTLQKYSSIYKKTTTIFKTEINYSPAVTRQAYLRQNRLVKLRVNLETSFE